MPDPNIRKADKVKFQQLVGGDDDFDDEGDVYMDAGAGHHDYGFDRNAVPSEHHHVP